jgi:hypothetical protein
MTRSTYNTTVLYLKELSEFILDLKSLRSIGVPALLKKYESSQFMASLESIRLSRSAYEKLLVKSVAKKVELLKTLSRVIIVEDNVEPIKKKEVTSIVETKKKSKKNKK